MLLLAATDLKVRLLGFSQNWFNSAVSFVLSIEGSLTVRDALHLCRINVQGSGLVLTFCKIPGSILQFTFSFTFTYFIYKAMFACWDEVALCTIFFVYFSKQF